MIAGINDSSTSPVRGTRHPLKRLAASATSGWCATKPVASSRSPSMAGNDASAHSAPGPHEVASTADPAASPRRNVDGPCGVRMARQMAPSGSRRNVGSLPLRRRPPITASTSRGRPGVQSRTWDAVTGTVSRSEPAPETPHPEHVHSAGPSHRCCHIAEHPSRTAVPKKQASQDRKARIAELQQREKARERRVRNQIIAGCAALLIVLGAVITFAVIDAGKQQPDVAISAIGVPASAASCDPVTTDKAGGNGNHVGPGTSTPTTTKVKYDTVPPSNGPHFVSPAVNNGRNYYTATDRPQMEVLVHNLEHGYTVLWYDVTAGNAKKAELQQLADAANKTDWALGKFIVSAWDPTYGALPAGKKFALSHWSATLGADQTTVASQAGHRQLCGDLSGAVVKAFVQRFPRTSAPEPGGA